MASQTPTLELEDIQGIVLFAYATLAHAAYVHVTFPPDARVRPNAWLAKVAADVAGADVRTGKHGEKINVALTAEGLTRMGLTKKELESFPRELQQGMGHDLRAHVLGDEGENHPDTWEVGGPKTRPVHALLMLFAHEEEALTTLRQREAARAADYGGEVVHVDEARIQDREHFGFADGIEQPHVAGSPRKRPEHFVEVPAGEFILGYPNAYGELPPMPRGGDDFPIGRNGTFLVYRKLRQDVSTFWSWMLENAARDRDHDGSPDDPPEVVERRAVHTAARMVGRWPSGAPLVHHPLADVPEGTPYQEDFGFAKLDPDGIRCPLGAHIRRANPRDMLLPGPTESMKAVQRHRLLRRGRPYGPPPPESITEKARPDGAERGLVFVVLNASIRRQFEFVQQTWINNSKFAGLYDERDPLVATVHDANAQMTIQACPVRSKLQGIPRFVTMRGGAYFFLPGRKALAWIAARRA
ncbi:MAG: Dyp-type peroxidase [Deltaproteobacteria bacterium]|nr:Dyp-type peroxidase [Deltaproteobacteria bacterium]